MSSKLRLLESELQRCDRELFSLRANFSDEDSPYVTEESNRSEAEDDQSETDEIDISQSFTFGYDFFSDEWNSAFPLVQGHFEITDDGTTRFVLKLKCFERHIIEIRFFERDRIIAINITHPNKRKDQIGINMQNHYHYYSDTNVEYGLYYFHISPSLRLYEGMEHMFLSLIDWNMNKIRKNFGKKAAKTFPNQIINPFRDFYLQSEHHILYECKDGRNKALKSNFFQVSTNYLSFYTIKTKEQPDQGKKGWIKTFLASSPSSQMDVTMTGGEIDKDSLKTQLVELRTKLYGTQ